MSNYILVLIIWLIGSAYFLLKSKRIDKKYYKILTDGKEFKIKYPSGFTGSSTHKTIEEVKRLINSMYEDDLRQLENKKKKWRVVKNES